MNYRVHEVPYKEARRAFARLLREHAEERADMDEFEAADRSICPELYDRFQREDQFATAHGELEERLLVMVADAWGLDPVILDDVMHQMYNHETDCLLRALAAPLKHRLDFVNNRGE